MSNNYYYEQPYEEVTTTTSTLEEAPDSSDNRRRLIIIVLIVVGVILVLLLILLLTNKGTGTNTNNNNNNGLDTTKKVTLQFRGAFLDPAVIQPLLDEYHTQNPNVTIQYANKWPDGDFDTAAAQYKADLNKVLKNNDSVNIPDIFMVKNTWVGDYDDAKYTTVNPDVDYNSFKSTFYPAVADDFAHDQKVHGVPLWMDTLAIIYNKDLLQSSSSTTPPTEWNQFREYARSLTQKDSGGQIKVGGFAAGSTANVSYAFEMSNLLLLQNGVSMTNAQGQPSFAVSSDSVSALQFYQSFAQGSNATWNQNFKNDSAAFLEGKVAMIAATSYRYREIQKYNKAYELKLSIGVSQIPQISGQSQSVINFADYWGAMVAASRPNYTYAWAFLNWLTQPDQLKLLSQNVSSNTQSFGILYPRKDMSSLLENDADLSVFNASLPFAETWYMGNGSKVKDEFLNLLGGTIDQGTLQQAQTNVATILTNKGNF